MGCEAQMEFFMVLVEQGFNGRVLRAKDAAAFLALGESTFWKWVKDGRLPKGTHLSARATVWRIADLEAFIEQQAANHGGIQ
jgi:predicted DNA-binding transcriptional regulator AlpA